MWETLRMNENQAATEAQNFARIVSALKRAGLHDAPIFSVALRSIKNTNDTELTRLVSEYPDRDEFESLLFLYWDT